MSERSAVGLAAVDAAGGAGLADDDLREQGQARADLAPDPAGEVLAGRVVEAGDLVEVVVVEDGVATIWPEVQRAALDIMRRAYARVMSAKEVADEVTAW